MSAQTTNLEIVTPESLVCSEAVIQVDIAGEDGDFGVLANHSPLISSLKPGVLTVYKEQDKTSRYYVTSGFVEVTPERCTVLATSLTDLDAVTKEEIEKQLKASQLDLDTEIDETKKSVYQKRVTALTGIFESF